MRVDALCVRSPDSKRTKGTFGDESVYWTGYLTFFNEMVCQHKVCVYMIKTYSRNLYNYIRIIESVNLAHLAITVKSHLAHHLVLCSCRLLDFTTHRLGIHEHCT